MQPVPAVFLLPLRESRQFAKQWLGNARGKLEISAFSLPDYAIFNPMAV
jgi:hypothetical protein